MSLRERALVVAVAGVLVWLFFDALVIAFGESPRELIALLLRGTWGTPYGVGQVLYKATPLLFSGLSVSFALRAGLFNIGAESQMAVGALVAALVGAHVGGLSPFVAVPCVLVAAAVAGGAWAAPAAALRARYGVHEVISTILLNRVADAGITFALAAGLAQKATVRTADVAASARLPRLDRWFPALHGSAVSVSLMVALSVLALVVLSFHRSRFGRELFLVANGPDAAAAERIPVARRRFQALVVAGGIAGLAASATVLGFKGGYEAGLGAGAGFTGIAVALLGRESFFGLACAALLFGTLQQGGLVLNARVPMELMDVLQAIVILVVGAADPAVRRWFREARRPADAPASTGGAA